MKLYINTSSKIGTKVLGSAYEQLTTEYAGNDIDYIFESEGKIIVDPSIGNKYEDWWIMAKTSNGLASFYRSLVAKRFGVRLIEPSFNSHISIITGEKPLLNEDQWKKFHGEKITFKYSNEIFTNGYFFWIRVQSPEMIELREYYGLPPIGKYFLHNTIAKTHPSDITLY